MLLSTLLFTVLTFALCATGAPSVISGSPHVVHESRRSIPLGWAPVRRADPSMVLPLRFGLVQPNLDYLEDFVMDVSHPESPNYGKHWSATKIAQTFRPAKESIETVHLWLVESGIDRASVRLSQGGGWLKANVTVEQAERLLQTEYHVYQSDEEGGGQHIACYEKYHLPEHVARHVDIVTPTLHFDTKPRTSVPQKIDMDKRDRPVNARSLGQPELGVSIPKTAATIEVSRCSCANRLCLLSTSRLFTRG